MQTSNRLTLCILMGFSMQIYTIRMGMSVIHKWVIGRNFPNNSVLQSLKVVFTLANNEGPDEMLHIVKFHPSLHCLLKYEG